MKQADRDEELQESARIKAEADTRSNTAAAIQVSLDATDQCAPLRPLGETMLAAVTKEIEDKKHEVETGQLKGNISVIICELDHIPGTTCPGCNQSIWQGKV